MNRRRLLTTGLAMPLLPVAAKAQAWPTRPLRLVVPIAAGGALDFVGRLIAEKLQAQLGQPVVVENRAGAGGNVGAAHVAAAEKDGQVLLLAPAYTLAANPALYGRAMPIEPMRDLAPVTRVSSGTVLLVVHRDRPWRSFGELVAAAREAPGRITMGISGVGSTSHLAIALLRQATGADVTVVPYRGGNTAVGDLVAGTIDMMFDALPALIPFVEEGRFRPLAVGASRRVTSVPALRAVPCMAELLPGAGFDLRTWYSIVVPQGTPAPIVGRLHQALLAVVRTPDYAARLASLGLEPESDESPAAFAEFWRADEPRWRELVRLSGARAE